MILIWVIWESVADDVTTVYACGSGEKGQLGNGRTGEHIATGNRTGFDVESEPSESVQICLRLDAHDDCTSFRQGFGRKEDRTNRLRAAAQHRTRRGRVRPARLILEV